MSQKPIYFRYLNQIWSCTDVRWNNIHRTFGEYGFVDTTGCKKINHSSVTLTHDF